MTTDDRTPDAREVRAMYDAGSNLYRETPEQHYLGHPAPDYGAEFDRFLARVRRDAQADAWDEGFEVGESNGYAIGRDIDTDENTENPYREQED